MTSSCQQNNTDCERKPMDGRAPFPRGLNSFFFFFYLKIYLSPSAEHANTPLGLTETA